LTISSDVLPGVTLTLHPVSFSKGFTHEFSVYPGQATRLRAPSPSPIWLITLGLGELASPVFVGVPLLQLAATSAASPTKAIALRN
jgi:hypothetical protein